MPDRHRKRYIHGDGVFIAFHIDVAIKLHAVADGGTAEFTGGQVDKRESSVSIFRCMSTWERRKCLFS